MRFRFFLLYFIPFLDLVRFTSSFTVLSGVPVVVVDPTRTTRSQERRPSTSLISLSSCPGGFLSTVSTTTGSSTTSSCTMGYRLHHHLQRTGGLLVLALAGSSSSSTTEDNDSKKREQKSSSPSSTTDTAADVVVTKLPGSRVEIQIPVTGIATQAAYDKVCMELSKQISIPGFRKGSKIPAAVLEQTTVAKGGSKYAIKTQTINELMSQLVESTLKQKGLDPIGQPIVSPSTTIETMAQSLIPGKPIDLLIQCDVWPEIEWTQQQDEPSSSSTNKDNSKPYMGLAGTYQRRPPNEIKLQKALNDLRERYVTLEPITTNDNTNEPYTLQMGDACTVNMVGYMAQIGDTNNMIKGELLPNAASGDNVPVVLETGRYMTGLVEGLIGAKPGEMKTITVSFPEKLRDKTLAGKQAIFDVEVLSASKRIIPEVNDEFAARVRVGLTAESLLRELQKAIEEEDAKEFVPARNKALADALSKVMEVDIPDSLITNQAREKYAVMMAEMRDNGGVSDEEIRRQITPENFAKYKEIVKDDIIRDFKVSMATDEIARLEGITVPDYQVEEQFQAIKKDADAENAEDFDETMIRAKVKTALERQAVMDWLAEHAQLNVVYEKEMEFDENLMQQLAEESLEREKKMLEAKAVSTDISSSVMMEMNKKEIASTDDAMEVLDAVIEQQQDDSNINNNKEAEVTVPVVTTVQEDEATRAARYAAMSLEDRAYQILVDLGSIKVNDDASTTDYDDK